ncbi:hypothetical protein ACRYCC_43245 [Actinomadura scrupuli]|uniref:hypothetical protein n=1 Tax=Actinomadura scrupuli TaxID=559629 RepID=UPI003D998B6B
MTTYVISGGIRRGSAERLVVAAAMAPAVQEDQAWRFRVRPGLIEVEADPARLRTVRDPQGRSLHIGCGTALLNLRLAAAQLGREPVLRLSPDRSRPMLLATVRLAGPHRTTRLERALYAATLHPLPSRQPQGDERPASRVVNELAHAVRLEGAALHALPAGTAVLTTRGDGPDEWLRAGQALQRLILTAATLAVSASFRDEVAGAPGVDGVVEPGDVPQVLVTLARTAISGTRP